MAICVPKEKAQKTLKKQSFSFWKRSIDTMHSIGALSFLIIPLKIL